VSVSVFSVWFRIRIHT